MKTKIIILLMAGSIFLVINCLNAQETRAGIKGGLNSATLTGYTGNSRISGHAGVFVHNVINNRWCFQPELLFSGEGQRYFGDGEKRTIALDYIQLPLMIQYFPIRQLYLEAGPQVGILASARDKGSNGLAINIKNDFSNAQVGMNIGVGVKANNSIGFYGRYCFGLTDVSTFDNIVDHSRVGQVGLSIRLK